MKEAYLEVTYRRGRVVAAYYHLPSQRRRKAAFSRRAESGLIVDLAADGSPLGIEITAPAKATPTALNRVLRELGCPPVRPGDLAPLRAA